MHWFKILLLCLLVFNVLAALIKSRKGKHTIIKEAWEYPLAAVLELLLLWGVVTYL